MNILLRSVMMADKADKADLAYQNFLTLHQSGLTFDVAEDVVVWQYLSEFALAHNHSPDITTLRAHFTSVREDGVVSRLEALVMYQPLYRGDFEVRLTKRMDEKRVRTMQDLLREAASIVQTGVEIKDGKDKKILHGPIDAMNYLMDKAHEVVAPVTNARLAGEVTGDVDDFLMEYERRKADPLSGIGQFTGLSQMDDALSGAKKYELWTHAAFTGGLKSTLMVNWAYNQAVYFGHSVLIYSLEMPYEQVRRIFMAIHSMHPRFRQVRIDLGLQTDPNTDTGLPYQKMRDGQLSDNEEVFLREYVVPDFKGNAVVSPMNFDPNGGYGQIHIEVAPPDKTDFTMLDVKSRAEVLYQKSPFQMLFLDHMGLMSSRNRYSSTTEKLNEVVRDAKRLAMSFNRGQGMAVVGLFQISREGYKAAEKNEGNYNLTHLSYANECVINTLIPTGSGLRFIADLNSGTDSVWSLCGFKPVRATFDQGVRPTWLLTLDNNATLEGTGNHRVRVVREERLAWATLETLREGDFVVSSKATYPWAATAVGLPPLTLQKGEQKASAPSHMTAELAYLLGAWDGDGNNGGRGICYTGNRKETGVQQALQDAFKATFGVDLSLALSPSRLGSFDLSNSRAALKRWFVGLSGLRGQQVPTNILRGQREHVCAYLRGLFDTDGTINTLGTISLASKHEAFLREVQLILSMLGMDSYLGSKQTTLKATGKTYTNWFLNIRTQEGAKAFATQIGFTDVAKAARLSAKLANPPKHKKPDERLPFAQMVVDLIRTHLPYGRNGVRRSVYNNLDKYLKEGSVPADLTRYVVGCLAEMGVDNAGTRFLGEVLDHWQIHTVKSCAPTGRQEQVYDIEVDGDHEYQTGPLLSHNCERSSDIVTTSYVNDAMRKENKVRFQCLKSRDNKPFDPFFARVEWPYRRILQSYDFDLVESQKDAIGAAIDNA